MQERIEKIKIDELALEEEKLFSSRVQDFEHFRNLIQRQEHELNVYRKQLKEEQLARARELQSELDAREKFFAEREKSLIERQREFERHLRQREVEIEALRAHLQKEIAEKEAKLQQALIDLQLEKERYSEESRRKIEQTSKDYVVDALNALDKKEKQFHFISKVWSAIGAVSLSFGMVFFVYITISSSFTLPLSITWEFITFSVFKGLVAVSLLAGLTKYSFLFSNSYMQESLKNADRRHAINFGKFYLESYGAAAEWSQVKEAFEHWNISGTNAFNRHEDPTTEISALEKAVLLIERVSKSLPPVKKEAS